MLIFIVYYDEYFESIIYEIQLIQNHIKIVSFCNNGVKKTRYHKTLSQKLSLKITPYRTQLIRQRKSLEWRGNQFENKFSRCQKLTQVSVKSKTQTLHKVKKADTKNTEDELLNGY